MPAVILKLFFEENYLIMIVALITEQMENILDLIHGRQRKNVHFLTRKQPLSFTFPQSHNLKQFKRA